MCEGLASCGLARCGVAWVWPAAQTSAFAAVVVSETAGTPVAPLAVACAAAVLAAPVNVAMVMAPS